MQTGSWVIDWDGLISGAFGAAAVAILFLTFSKKYLENLATRRFNLELENRKGELQRELESHKHSLALEVERLRIEQQQRVTRYEKRRADLRELYEAVVQHNSACRSLLMRIVRYRNSGKLDDLESKSGPPRANLRMLTALNAPELEPILVAVEEAEQELQTFLGDSISRTVMGRPFAQAGSAIEAVARAAVVGEKLENAHKQFLAAISEAVAALERDIHGKQLA